MMAADRVRARLGALAGVGLDVPGFAAAAVEVLGTAVPFAAACVAPADPATELITGALKYGALDNDSDDQWAFWEYEAGETWNFQETVRRPGGVTSTHAETQGHPELSRRHVEFFQPTWGFSDELRAALTLGGQTWGFVALFRSDGATAFTPAEQAFIASLTPALARGFRAGLVTAAAARLGAAHGPAVVIVDETGAIEQASIGAEERMAALDLAPAGTGQLPTVLSTLASSARAYAAGHGTQAPRMRLRTADGTWMVAHAASMVAAGRPNARVVITIEDARPPEIIPLIVAAFGLTAREQSLVRLVLEGAGTAEIASTLHLSAYTVQDHLKSIFEKVGVRSRRELTARIFYDHYAPRLTEPAPALSPSGWFAPPGR